MGCCEPKIIACELREGEYIEEQLALEQGFSSSTLPTPQSRGRSITVCEINQPQGKFTRFSTNAFRRTEPLNQIYMQQQDLEKEYVKKLRIKRMRTGDEIFQKRSRNFF